MTVSHALKVITFDAGNTLIRLSHPVGVTYAGVAKRFGADLELSDGSGEWLPDRVEDSPQIG